MKNISSKSGVQSVQVPVWSQAGSKRSRSGMQLNVTE
ncbi:MAG: hypothetical protein ACLUJR_04320 [Mediterraneibacter gnavus]